MNHPKMMYTYVGLDSHKESHTAVFLDCFFEKLGEVTFKNLPSHFDDFLKEAEGLKRNDTEFLFGLEDVSAYGRTLTTFLVEHDQKVKHVNALLVARERNNQNIIEKTDSIDAECAARVLLSKLDTLPDAKPQDEYIILRSLVVRRKFIVRNITALKNHLYCQITTHYPNYQDFFKNIDCNSSLAFLERYPSPESLKYTTIEELTAVIHEPSKGRVGARKAAEILDHVERNGFRPLAFQDMQDMAVQSTIRQLRFHMEELETVEISLAQFLSRFECTLTSMVGIDIVTAAGILSCIGDIKKFRTPAKLARYSGIAPVTHASGKKDLQFANQRGNKELHHLFHEVAHRLSMTVGSTNKVLNPFFFDYYQRKLSEGKTKRQALKCLERRLVNIVWTMLTYNEEYVNPPMYDLPKKKEIKKNHA